ncbi:iron export ABC transporter permease subunit FetB [Balneolaceae bacterium ANBcel3]|nr:iron export ABC transporter permease subunit FetB [Balneolaceae bacterium ANBcel3]
MEDTQYIVISNLQLGLAALLLLVNIGLSIALKLGLAKDLIIASIRMAVQLVLVGLILEWVFEMREPWFILLMAFFMAGLAGYSAVDRTSRRYPGIFWNSLVTIGTSAFLVTGLAITGILRVDPWFDPQYMIPLLGMVLGNALTGISLGLDRMMEGCVQNRNWIETMLSHGATRWEAAHEHIREALRTGMIPTVNAMMIMGIVSLPGMMTGQILAGAAPMDAVRYQMVIMFMIAACTALATLGVVLFAYNRLFSRDHRLMNHLIRQK